MNTIEHEQYKDFYYISFIEGYLVNKNGDFLSIKRNKLIKKHVETSTGNLRAVFNVNGKQITYFAARVVAKVFLQEIQNKPFVGYKDGNSNNINLDNLFFTSTSEQQRLYWDNKRIDDLKNIPLPLFAKENNGLFPNPIECKFKKDYYFIPFEQTHIVINRNGDLFNLITNKEHPFHLDDKGYRTTRLGKNNYKVHRLLGFLFVEVPKRHLSKPFSVLQINHMDGIKQNNFLGNLEWVDHDENLEHARKLGLFKNEKKVLTRNILTNEITDYVSLSECARQNLLSSSVLSTHLNSFSAGCIVYNGLVFKFDNNYKWPTILAEDRYENYIGRTCDIIGENITTKDKIIFGSLKDACLSLNLSLIGLNNNRSRFGFSSPYKNWIFSRLSDHIDNN